MHGRAPSRRSLIRYRTSSRTRRAADRHHGAVSRYRRRRERQEQVAGLDCGRNTMSARLLSRLARLEHMTDASGRTVYVWLNDGDTVEARTAALIGSGVAEPNDHFQ